MSRVTFRVRLPSLLELTESAQTQSVPNLTTLLKQFGNIFTAPAAITLKKREQSDEHRKLRDCVQRVVIARELKAKAIVVRRFARRLRPDMKCAAAKFA